jgi:Tfp pilus assembly protein PilX
MIPPRPSARSERGFSMILVILAMLVTAMFIAGGFAAANGDLPVSGISKDRKQAYAAAEAGLNFYLNHLQQDNDYWTKCDQVPAPNAAENNPVNQQVDPTHIDTRRWRNVPDSAAQYTIELLHTEKYTKCEVDPKKQDSLIDLSSGTFKIRVTGRAYEGKEARKRSIVATFRRKGFLNFIYFTDYETIDPQALARKSDRDAAQLNCANTYRAERAGKGCIEIQFVTGDELKGPVHTNDDNLLICGSPVFGRAGRPDTVEVTGPDAPGYVKNGSGCGNTPAINTPTGKVSTGSAAMNMPTSNEQLADVAESGGLVYAGKTVVRLKNGGLMDVTNYATGAPVTQTNVAWPINGVLYVKNNGACTGEYPTAAKYTESIACGNLYISGTYSTSLTVAAANDVIIRPTAGGLLSNKSNDANLTRVDGSDATLGLIANNFVRVAHMVHRNSDGTCNSSNNGGNVNTTNDPIVENVRIDGAILSLQHSFIVDNYECGKLDTLTVNGAIAQKYRGPVGTGSGSNPVSGFIKDYVYDDRFRYRSPPYFLNPVDSAWDVIRQHEQVPAR